MRFPRKFILSFPKRSLKQNFLELSEQYNLHYRHNLICRGPVLWCRQMSCGSWKDPISSIGHLSDAPTILSSPRRTSSFHGLVVKNLFVEDGPVNDIQWIILCCKLSPFIQKTKAGWEEPKDEITDLQSSSISPLPDGCKYWFLLLFLFLFSPYLLTIEDLPLTTTLMTMMLRMVTLDNGVDLD